MDTKQLRGSSQVPFEVFIHRIDLDAGIDNWNRAQKTTLFLTLTTRPVAE